MHYTILLALAVDMLFLHLDLSFHLHWVKDFLLELPTSIIINISAHLVFVLDKSFAICIMHTNVGPSWDLELSHPC
jgi:hypothetical protein